MKFVHALDARAVLEPSDLVELVLEFLARDLLEPFFPDNTVVFFLFLPVVNNLLTSFSTNRCGISNTFLDLLLRLDASFYIFDDLDLFFLDGLLLADLDLREAR